MKHLVALSLLAMLASGACSEPAATGPASHDVTPGISAARSSFARSGALHVEKECSTYTGQAGDICTITFSSLKEIEVGSRIIYAEAASNAGYLDTDVRLVPPGRGNSIAFGHCSVDLTKIDGTTGCEFAGGTGRFTWFHASVVLTVVGGPVLAWDGTYSFSPRD